MRLEITQISTDEYVLEELIYDDIPEKYFYTDKGELLVASSFLESEKTVYQLLQVLFQNKATLVEVYRDDRAFVLDLSTLREHLIDFDRLDAFYQNCIAETGRENNMDEYGMFLDYIGQAMQTANKRYLLMICCSTADQSSTPLIPPS